MIELVIGGKTKRSTLGQHPVSLDWDAIPDASKDFVIRYGLKQYLADGMAGAEDEAAAKAGVEARVEKLVTGDLSRTNGGGLGKPDTVETRTLKLARAAVRDLAKAQEKVLTKEQVAEAASAWVKMEPKFAKEAAKQIAAEKAAAESAVEGAGDLLASLLQPKA